MERQLSFSEDSSRKTQEHRAYEGYSVQMVGVVGSETVHHAEDERRPAIFS